MSRGPLPTATATHRSTHLITASLLCAVLAWFVYLLVRAVALARDANLNAAFAAIATAALTMWQLVLSRYPRQPSATDPVPVLSVAVLLPVYNEDPAILRRCLRSLLAQSTVPDRICVVDDGSTQADYATVRSWFLRSCARGGIRGHWQRQDNRGKRRAQIAAARLAPDAAIFLTIDSDSLLDRQAVSEGLKPFADPRVQSVAGIVLAANPGDSLITRLTDVWMVSAQLTERSTLSRYGSVLVNPGGLAFYRAEILREHETGYLGETFAGRPVPFSDDSLLTLYSLARGRAVAQVGAFAFCVMPTTLSHHLRQQTRWQRGAFIRSIWRLRYLPTDRVAYWAQLVKWAQYAVTTIATLALAGWLVADPALLLWVIPVHAALYYTVMLPYLSVRRSDGRRQQWANYLLAPISGLWFATALRVVRWYAMATVLHTGWGTRERIEVHHTPAPAGR